jgi:hypothetical protein
MLMGDVWAAQQQQGMMGRPAMQQPQVRLVYGTGLCTSYVAIVVVDNQCTYVLL